MIVRLMGEGQYRVDESVAGELHELDERATAAAEAGETAPRFAPLHAPHLAEAAP